jgi:hypothetical protein
MVALKSLNLRLKEFGGGELVLRTLDNSSSVQIKDLYNTLASNPLFTLELQKEIEERLNVRALSINSIIPKFSVPNPDSDLVLVYPGMATIHIVHEPRQPHDHCDEHCEPDISL